jgi:hypothetical protein
MDKQRRAAIRPALLVFATLASAAPALAQSQTPPPNSPRLESNLTVYAGYRFGGELTDVTTGNTWQLTEGPAYSLAADFPLSPNTQWELFLSRRNSALKASGLFSPVVDNVGLDITYFHVGGTYFADQVGRGVYGVGGLGATQLSPDQAGLSSETHFSINLGIGYMIPATKHVGLKLEARGFDTLLNSSGGMFCSGGCVVQVKGTTMTQGELSAGIVARF